MKEWLVVLDSSGHYRAVKLSGLKLQTGEEVLDWELDDYIGACWKADGLNIASQVMET